MKKIIRADELKVGDFVQELVTWQTSRRFRVTKVDVVRGRYVHLGGAGSFNGVRNYSARDEFILLHRPWPKGKMEADMLNRINEAVRQATVRVGVEQPYIDKRSFPTILEALEAYELGKPQKK